MPAIHNPKDVFQLSRAIHTKTHEWLLVFYLNEKGKVLYRDTFKANQAELSFSPQSIFTRAISCTAHFVIMCHNHPSGKLLPSAADLYTTTAMTRMGKSVGVTLIDHIIVTPHSYHSIMQNATVLLPSAPQVHQ